MQKWDWSSLRGYRSEKKARDFLDRKHSPAKFTEPKRGGWQRFSKYEHHRAQGKKKMMTISLFLT